MGSRTKTYRFPGRAFPPPAVLLLLLRAPALAGTGGGVLLHECDFDAGVIDGVRGDADRAGAHSAYVVSDPVREGRFAVRFELRPGDPPANRSFRAELTFPPDSMETERWYRWSVFLPRGFTADPIPDIIAQWHGVPDEDRGEPLRHPPLRVRRHDDRWELTLCSDPRPAFESGDHRLDTTLVLGRVEEQRWTDWLFHVRWSHGPGGYVRGWIDGAEVVRYAGPVGYDDRRGPFFKWGIYKPGWKSGRGPRLRRVLYFDEVRAGEGAPDLRSIFPAGE